MVAREGCGLGLPTQAWLPIRSSIVHVGRR